MSDVEEAIWEAFQVDPPDWLGIEPDFSGHGDTLTTWDGHTGTDTPELIRIDGIVESDLAVWVCDVQETLGYESLGRVLSQTSIYRRRKQPENPVIPCLVFATFDGASAGVLDAVEDLQEDVNVHRVADIPEKLRSGSNLDR